MARFARRLALETAASQLVPVVPSLTGGNASVALEIGSAGGLQTGVALDWSGSASLARRYASDAFPFPGIEIGQAAGDAGVVVEQELRTASLAEVKGSASLAL